MWLNNALERSDSTVSEITSQLNYDHYSGDVRIMLKCTYVWCLDYFFRDFYIDFKN